MWGNWLWGFELNWKKKKVVIGWFAWACMCYNNCGLVERQHREFALRVLSLSSESNLGGNSYSNRISLIFHRACNFIFAYNQTWRPSSFLFFCSTRVKQRREKINKQNAVNMIVKAYSWYVNLNVVLAHKAVQRKKGILERLYMHTSNCFPEDTCDTLRVVLCDFYITVSRSFSCQIRSYEKRKRAKSWNSCLGSPFFFIYWNINVFASGQVCLCMPLGALTEMPTDAPSLIFFSLWVYLSK